MADINDLIRKRNLVIEAGNAILDKAQEEDRALTDEEQANFDKSVEDSQRLRRQIDGRAQIGEPIPAPEPQVGPVDDTAEPGDPPAENRFAKLDPKEKRMAAFSAYRTKKEERTAFDEAAIAEDEKSHAAFRAFLQRPQDRTVEEKRALAVIPDTSGGYTLAPQKFVAELIQAVDNDVFMRQICRIHTLVEAHSLGAPSLSADPADPTWTTEAAIGSEDSTMAFSKRELVPSPLAQYIKVSRTLLRRSAIPVDALVRERLAYKASVVLENAYLNGNGAAQPLGIFTASALGVNTGQDVSTGNASTSIQTDGLLEAQHKLHQKYRAGAVWVFHDDAIKQIRKLKDGDGQYIWRRGLDSTAPDMLLGNRIYTSYYAPNTFTASLYVGAYFVPRFYWIVDTLNYEIQRLDELYAGANQVGFISRAEHDGAPVLEEAFVRVKLGS